MAKRKQRRAGTTAASSGGADTIRQYALAGAHQALTKLREEMQIIERTFPELSSSRGRAKIVATTTKSARTMSAAARKAVSARMKKYWAERRKAKAASGK